MRSEALIELDSLCNSLSRTIHVLSVIQSAIENDVLSEEADAPEALLCVWEQLWDIKRKFSDILDAEFARKRPDGEFASKT